MKNLSLWKKNVFYFFSMNKIIRKNKMKNNDFKNRIIFFFRMTIRVLLVVSYATWRYFLKFIDKAMRLSFSFCSFCYDRFYFNLIYINRLYYYPFNLVYSIFFCIFVFFLFFLLGMFITFVVFLDKEYNHFFLELFLYFIIADTILSKKKEWRK